MEGKKRASLGKTDLKKVANLLLSFMQGLTSRTNMLATDYSTLSQKFKLRASASLLQLLSFTCILMHLHGGGV